MLRLSTVVYLYAILKPDSKLSYEMCHLGEIIINKHILNIINILFLDFYILFFLNKNIRLKIDTGNNDISG